MRKVLNKYSVWFNNQCWLNDIADYEGALQVVDLIMNGGAQNAIISQYKGDTSNALEFERFKRSFWFKPNNYNILIKVVRTNEVVEVNRFDDIDNLLIRPIKAYNGKGLKLNSIEPKAKWKPNDFHDKETWFALSVWRNKGWSTLGRTKKQRNSGGNCLEVYDKLSAQLEQGVFNAGFQIEDRIISLKKEGKTFCEIKQTLRGKGISNRKLSQLIASV